MRILVTGLNGLIGWHIYRRYLTGSSPVLGTYREPHPGLKNMNVQRFEFENPDAVTLMVRNFDPQIIIHSWAMCDLDLCEEMPGMAYRINVAGTRDLLTAAQKLKNLKLFAYISTDHVFDGESGNYSESDIPRPKHAYGRTKLEAERVVRESGLPWQIIRPGLVIGKSLQGSKGPRDFLLRRIRAGKPTHYFTDEWRTPIRAEDMADRTLQTVRSQKSGIFHIAGEEIFNRYDLARQIAEENGHSTEHIYPRLRREDRWAAIRPKNLSLRSLHSVDPETEKEFSCAF